MNLMAVLGSMVTLHLSGPRGLLATWPLGQFPKFEYTEKRKSEKGRDGGLSTEGRRDIQKGNGRKAPRAIFSPYLLPL